jgi:hypothetical protein
MPLPRTQRHIVLRFEWVGDVLASVAAVVLSTWGLIWVRLELIKADRIWAPETDSGHLAFTGLWLIGAASVLTVCGGTWRVAVGVLKSKKEDLKQSPTDISACCEMTHAGLKLIPVPSDFNGVRVTVYRVHSPVRGRDGWLEQLVPYAGAGGGEVGRKVPIRCGVIGRVVRCGEPSLAVRVSEDVQEFWNEMRSEWGFTLDEAKNLDSTRWSWFAVPMLEKTNVVGVVYFDSTDPDYFNDDRKPVVIGLATALIEYAKRRY